ncbi:hypothetical protein FOZ61_009025 [Perkinsus olseni]|uniref:Uncharacterized protein n=1 Tax=Perkinsus olseni TaxID=32597 RepID=A0A7J6M5Z4_PEROL|nr:hypothetical protein FOZ61_009025 [Perkinsus olseni]KAF4670371.1 hypothetical protein FOL46_000888 [Perkinsus olseni]
MSCKSGCASFCAILSAVAVPVLVYFALLCGSGSRLIEVADKKKPSAAVGCWIAAALYALTFIGCYAYKKKLNRQEKAQAAANYQLAEYFPDLDRLLALTTNPHYFPVATKVKELVASNSPAKVDVTNEDYILSLSEMQRSSCCSADSDTSSCQDTASVDSELVYEFGLAIEECLEMCARWGLEEITNLSEAAESDASEDPWVILPESNEGEDFVIVADGN